MHGIIFIGDYDYVAQNEGELTFKVGDNIRIYQSDGDWWYGELVRTGEIGWVAPSYGHTREESPYAAISKEIKDKKRKELFQVIIQGQSQFLSILNSFIESIVAPISIRDTAFKRTFMSEPSVAVSFSLLQEIYNACSNFDSILRRAKTDIEIANAYVQFAPSLQLFAQYASENIVLLNSVKTNIRQLTSFLSGGLNLEGTLILPLEHYPKYKIDFQEFVWLTSESAELDAVAGALDIIIGQTEYVDGKLKEEAESLMLLSLQNQFSGNPVIFTPSRRIIKEAEIERIKLNKEGGIVGKQYYAHLFNDAFIYSSKNVVTGRFKLHNVIDLKGAVLGKSDLLETVLSFSLAPKDDPKPEHFKFASDDTFRDWHTAINDQINSLKTHKINKRTSVITRSNVSLPGVDATQLGSRCALVYRFLLSELQFSEAMSLLNITVIQPLIAASKGAVLSAAKVKSSNIVGGDGDGLQIKEAQSKNQDALFDSSSNSASKYQIQVVTDALQDPDVQIFLRAAEGIALALQDFVNALESYCNTSSWSEDIVTGTFFNSVSALALYNQFKAYAGGQQATLRILKTQPFSQFYKDAEQYLQSTPGNLQDKIELPRKRVKHFMNFVSDLLKLTADSHADHACLTASESALNYMEKEIDELIRLKKNFEELLEIQSSLVSLKVIGTEPIIQKLASMDRTIIFQGDLKKVCRKKNKTFRFWLFNDYIIYGAALGGGKYSFNRALELDKCTVGLHTSTSLKNAFEIFGAEKSFIVIAPSSSNQIDWLEKIRKAAADYAALTNTIAGGKTVAVEPKSAPLWVPDSGSDNCIVCKQGFSFWNRRHHCRKCGLVVCGEHSKNKEVLGHIHKSTKQRICDNCFLGKTAPALIAKAEAAEKAGNVAGSAAAGATPVVSVSTLTPSTASSKATTAFSPAPVAASPVPVVSSPAPVVPATITTPAPAVPLKPGKSPKATPVNTTPVVAAPPVVTTPAPQLPSVAPPPTPSSAPPPVPTTAPPPVPTTAPPPVPTVGPPRLPEVVTPVIDSAPVIAAPAIPKSLPVKAPPPATALVAETPKKVGRVAPPPPPAPTSAPAPPTAAPVVPSAPVDVPVPRPPLVAQLSLENNESTSAKSTNSPPPPPPSSSAKITPPAPPAPTAETPKTPASTTSVEEDPYRKYRKMLEMLPEGAVVQKMSNDGIPQDEINKFLGKSGGEQPSVPPASRPAGPPPSRAGAPPPPPPGAVVGAPRPPAPPAAPATAAGTTEPIDEEFRKYVKMKEMLPAGAVKQKMIADGFAPNDIDSFLSGSVASISRITTGAAAAAPMPSMASLLASKPTLNKTVAAQPLPRKTSLMDEIQAGQKLKSVQKDDARMKTTPAIQGSGGLLGMLANEMSKRRFNMKVENDDDDSDSSGFSDSDSEDDD